MRDPCTGSCTLRNPRATLLWHPGLEESSPASPAWCLVHRLVSRVAREPKLARLYPLRLVCFFSACRLPRQVAVVEASYQAGGRVRTWQGPGGLAVDTGAQWIENEGADGRVNPIYALTKELDIPTVPNKCGHHPNSSRVVPSHRCGGPAQMHIAG